MHTLTANQASQVARPTLIASEWSELESTIEQLGGQIHQLLERIEPVLRQKSPAVAPSPASAPDSMLPAMGERIRSLRRQVANIAEYVQDVITRIEL